MKRSMVWYLAGLAVAIALTVRDVNRLAAIPRYSATLPELIPVQTVSNFHNAYLRAYSVHLTAVTVGTTKENECWYTDGSGYYKARGGGAMEEHFGRWIDSYRMELDSPGYVRTTHCFTFDIGGIHTVPVGVALGSDAASGAVAAPVDDLVYSTIAAKGKYTSKNACWMDDKIFFIGRYRIPEATPTTTVSLGIAPRQRAILYAETPMPGRWGRTTGSDLRLRLGCPTSNDKRFRHRWGDTIFTITPPVLPGADMPLPPYAYAVYAVDRFDREHITRPIKDCATVARQEVGLVADDVPRDQIVAVRVLVSPYVWTRFAHVPLKYQRSAASAKR